MHYTFGDKLFTSIFIFIIVSLLLLLLFYFLHTSCLNECCKEAGGYKMREGVCVDMNGNKVSVGQSCQNSCSFWR